MKDITITNNEAEKRFEMTVDGHLAKVEYRILEGKIAYNHTEVPAPVSGQGIGSKLAKHALEYARKHELLVLPYCPFIYSYIKDHPEYADLIAPSFRD